MVLALPLAAGAYLYMQEPEIAVTAAAVARGPVEQTVAAIASGTVMPARKSMVAAGGMGTIAAVYVAEGDQVQAGGLLVELDHAELDAQVTLAKANLKVGESRLEQARLAAAIYEEIAATRLSQTTAQWELAQSDYDRIKALSDKRAVSQSDFEKVEMALRVAREARAAATASQRENLVREEEIRSAVAAIEQLQAGVAVAEAARERAFVRAPFAGTVAKKLLDVGEAVAMGLPLLHLVQTSDCYIQVPFDEANAAEIALEQPVRITLDAYADTEFQGLVTYVSPAVSINPDLSRTLDLKVAITEGKEKFIAGMSADVTIIAQRKDNVILVPAESLIRDEYAYVLEGGRAVRREVKTGIGNWESQEILQGLREGETLITSVSVKGLEEGVKVRVVDELES